MTLQAGRIYGGVGRLGAARQGGIAAWLYGDYGGSGGARIDASNCVAAYCPIGAASYAASKVNLANPGTYNAYEGVQPNWTADGGWAFNGSSMYLKQDYAINNQGKTIIVRAVAGTAINRVILGGSIQNQDGWQKFQISNYVAAGVRYAVADKFVDVAPYVVSAEKTFAMAGVKCYRNGVYDGEVAASSTSNILKYYIGAQNISGSPGRYFDGSVKAIFVYNIALTAQQVAGLTGAINALTSAGNYYL